MLTCYCWCCVQPAGTRRRIKQVFYKLFYKHNGDCTSRICLDFFIICCIYPLSDKPTLFQNLIKSLTLSELLTSRREINPTPPSVVYMLSTGQTGHSAPDHPEASQLVALVRSQE